jgi:hypothetical protein
VKGPLSNGPAEYWSDDKAPTLGQLRALAAAGCKALGLPEPRTRLEATTALVRLQLADSQEKPTRKAA